MSPSHTQPSFLSTALKSSESTAGRTIAMSASPIQSNAPGAIAAAPLASAASDGSNQPVITPIGPHKPQVPMPEFIGAPFIWSLKRQVASGPVTAEASVGAIHIRGFFRMLLICSIDVPSL